MGKMLIKNKAWILVCSYTIIFFNKELIMSHKANIHIFHIAYVTEARVDSGYFSAIISAKSNIISHK